MTAATKTQIPIGQFSKMTRLSVKALRLYDAQGLLNPAYIDQTSGYRYYSLGQVYPAEIIRVLRSIDMPITEIQRIVNSENDDVLTEQLQAHKVRLNERLQLQEKALTSLEKMIQNKSVIASCEINLSEGFCGHVLAVKVHTSLRKLANDVQTGFDILRRGLVRSGLSPTGAPMALYDKVIDQDTDGDIELAVPVNASFASEGAMYGRRIEGGTMATVVHRGPYGGIAHSYRALSDWVSRKSYDIVGPIRETYINNPRTVRPEDTLTRLEFPVREAVMGVCELSELNQLDPLQ